MEEMGMWVYVLSPSYYWLTGKRKIGIFWEEEKRMNLTFSDWNYKLLSQKVTLGSS